jgi:hypothetical protein
MLRRVASHALDLFRAVPDLDVVYALTARQLHLGVMAAPDALGLRAEIVGSLPRAPDLRAVLRRRQAGHFGKTVDR